MWFSSDHSGVRIVVRGEFVAPRQWLVHATIARGPGIETTMGAVTRRRTLSELRQGILHENRVGRRRGAVDVRVVVDGDREIAGLFGATENPALSPASVR